jgi:hypothetical protein
MLMLSHDGFGRGTVGKPSGLEAATNNPRDAHGSFSNLFHRFRIYQASPIYRYQRHA